MKKLIKLGKGILTSFISFLVIFVILEIILRIFGNQNQFTTSSYPKEMTDKSSFTKMNPNFEGRFKISEFDAAIKINALGIRDRNLDPKDKRKKVLFIGDSFTFGHGVELDSSYVRIAENDLQNKYDSIVTINAGVPGTGPADYAIVFDSLNKIYQPDLVLLNLFVGNDIHWTRVTNNKGEMRLVDDEVKVEMKQFDLKTFLRENIQLYSFIVDRLKSIPSTRNMLKNLGLSNEVPGIYVMEVLNKKETELYKKKWYKVFEYIKYVKDHSKAFQIVIVPTKEQVYPDRLGLICKKYDLNIEHYDAMFPIRKIDSFAIENNIVTINLLDTLSKCNQDQLFFDIDPHFNKIGHKISGKFIAKSVDIR